jgi:GH35 family endo-1,4-beta-xylanase
MFRQRLNLTIAVLLLALLYPLTTHAYWGLRNIRSQWPDSIYSGRNGFNADFHAFAVTWGRTEPENDNWNWGTLDIALEFTERHSVSLVLLLDP